MTAVVLLGDINIDLLLDVPAYPAEGGEAIATRQTTSLGGSATNTAISVARLGFDARLLGRVGSDAWGRQAVADLTGAGVDCRWISTDAVEPTQLNIVAVTPGGERTMFAYRGANAQLGPDQVVPALFEGAKLLHLSGYALLTRPQLDAAMAAVAMARSHNIPVTLDVPAGVVREIAPALLPVLDQIDTIMLGEADFAGLDARGPDDLLRAGVRRVVVKRGRHGSSYYAKAVAVDVQGFEVDAVDTTGAGDAFAAGVILGILENADPLACCRTANALGAAAVSHVGAGLAMPGREALPAAV
ncbi:ribokinase [Devosia lucknowensis]|uniref:Ribokinase n=1 Tax=Devosia lucknowensis TaxID=1096929 RepID=A0A1Y6FQE2_9HYPH|nr:sugar kinase [Devosia lucknowensis]SMQ75691.1 ribokinase [Devosia lucknowensis]